MPRPRVPGGNSVSPRRLFAIGAIAFILTVLTLPLADAITKVSPDYNPVIRAVSVLGIVFLVGVSARLLAPGTTSWQAMFAGAFAGGVTYFAVVAVSGGENGLPLLLIPLLGATHVKSRVIDCATIPVVGWGCV